MENNNKMGWAFTFTDRAQVLAEMDEINCESPAVLNFNAFPRAGDRFLFDNKNSEVTRFTVLRRAYHVGLDGSTTLFVVLDTIQAEPEP
jgi:hypothetical protein